MSKSLRDQLMGTGIATKQQALKAKTSNKKKKRQAAKTGELTEQQLRQQALQKQKAEQTERDRTLNRQLEAERQEKAVQAQVKQLIEMNAVSRKGGDIGYNFAARNKVKKIYVTDEIQNKLTKGFFAIALLKEGDSEAFFVIPAKVASKIKERVPEAIVLHNDVKQAEESSEEDDWYADYEIPDDLMW